MPRRYLSVLVVTMIKAHSQEASGLDFIKREIQANQEYSSILRLSPAERRDPLRQMLSEGKLQFTSLVRQRMGLIALSSAEEARQAKAVKTGAILRKLIAPATGAMNNSSGSTSAVSGSGLPMMFNAVLERGGITQSTKGTVLSLKGNLLGIARGLGSSDAYCLALDCGKREDILRRFTFGVGFDMSRGTQETATGEDVTTNQPVTFNLRSAKEQFDHLTVRFDFRNKRDIRGTPFMREWEKSLAKDEFVTKAKAFSSAAAVLFHSSALSLSQTRGELITALEGANSIDEMAQLIDAAAAKGAQAVAAAGGTRENLQAYAKAKAEYQIELDTAARSAAQSFLHALEYSYFRPKNQPELSNVRYVGSGGFGKDEAWRATVNGALEFYHRPAGVKVGVLRDVQISAQLDRVFGAKSAVNVTFSAAAYYQWMKERALITITPGEVAPGTNIGLAGQAPTLLAPEGSIGLGQLKLTFGVRDTKIKFPLSFTFANRTELIKPTKPVLGGQFGISYAFDNLFQP